MWEMKRCNSSPGMRWVFHRSQSCSHAEVFPKQPALINPAALGFLQTLSGERALDRWCTEDGLEDQKSPSLYSQRHFPLRS